MVPSLRLADHAPAAQLLGAGPQRPGLAGLGHDCGVHLLSKLRRRQRCHRGAEWGWVGISGGVRLGAAQLIGWILDVGRGMGMLTKGDVKLLVTAGQLPFPRALLFPA